MLRVTHLWLLLMSQWKLRKMNGDFCRNRRKRARKTRSNKTVPLTWTSPLYQWPTRQTWMRTAIRMLKKLLLLPPMPSLEYLRKAPKSPAKMSGVRHRRRKRARRGKSNRRPTGRMVTPHLHPLSPPMHPPLRTSPMRWRSVDCSPWCLSSQSKLLRTSGRHPLSRKRKARRTRRLLTRTCLQRRLEPLATM